MTMHKLYIPAGYWLVASLTDYCMSNNIGNALVTGIGSITNIWILVNPDGNLNIRNWNGSSSYEMTSLLGNVTLRYGYPIFNPDNLPTGKYPEFDTSVGAFYCYPHMHTTFANPDMSILGGHLLDAQVSIGAELTIQDMSETGCVPGITSVENIPATCIYSEPVTIPPYGTFYNWDQRFWYVPSTEVPRT